MLKELTPFQIKRSVLLFGDKEKLQDYFTRDKVSNIIACDHAQHERLIKDILEPLFSRKDYWELSAIASFTDEYCTILKEQARPIEKQSFERWRKLYRSDVCWYYWPCMRICERGMVATAHTFSQWFWLSKTPTEYEQKIFECMVLTADQLDQWRLILFACSPNRHKAYAQTAANNMLRLAKSPSHRAFMLQLIKIYLPSYTESA